MITAVQYVKDAISGVGEFVTFDGYIGRLAIRKNLDIDKVAKTGDFLVLAKHNQHTIIFPLDPLNDICPLLVTDMNISGIIYAEDVYPTSDLSNFFTDYSFSTNSSNIIEEKEDKYQEVEECKQEEIKEGDKLMDFFFKEEKKSNNDSGFEFL